LTAPAVNADPYGYFGHLRETDPVHWNPLFKEWIVTRHSDVVWLIRQHELFSSAMPVMEAAPELYPPVDEADWKSVEELRETFRPLLHHDRPEHLAMRQVVHRWFTPKAVERWRAEMRATLRELIDARRSDGHMELKADLAIWPPLLTISWMLDVPRPDAALLRDLSATFLNPGFESDRMRRMIPAWEQLKEYFLPLIEERRSANPDEDLIAMLADGEQRGVFTRDQCLANVVLLLIAGHATTINLICNGVLTFMRNPSQWELLQSDPQGLAKSATEECLRYEPSVKGFFRLSTEDVELGEKLIRAGDRTFWVVASANRDPRVFPDPDTFDITRSPNPHIAFGGGIHHCLGAALARVEGQEAFSALAEMLPRLHLEEDVVEYLPSIGDRELSALHVGWS
jgi:cytochrome P450